MTLEFWIFLDIVLKIITLVVSGVVIWYLWDIWKFGRELAKQQAPCTLENHKHKVRWGVWWGFVAVCLIEAQVQLSPAPRRDDMWLYFHGAVDVMLVATLILILWRFTGRKRPDIHRWLVYVFFGECVLAMGSGVLLLVNLPF